MNRTKSKRLSAMLAFAMALSVLASGCESANGDNDLPPLDEVTIISDSTTAPEETDAVETEESTTTTPTTTTTRETTTTTPAETEPEPEGTTAPQNEETEAPVTAATAAEWSETALSGTMFITEDCYSREKALIGATTISRRYAGDSVEVIAITDTGYYKLAEGGFIHSDYLSDKKPVITEATTTTQATTTQTEASQSETTKSDDAPPFADPGAGGGGSAIEISSYNKSPESKYAFKQLSSAEQTLYKNIVSNVKSLDSVIEIPDGVSKDDVVKVYTMVYDSEPELFWMGDNISVGGSFATISFKTTDKSEISAMQKEIDSAAAKILSSANNYSGTFSKLKVFFDSIVLRSEFAKSEEGYNCSIYNGLTGKGNLQCSGYAKTMQYLCDLAGIESCVVRGTNSEGSTHAWNVVYCENGYYNLDTTWGDPINSFGSDYVQYEFFLVPDAWIHNITHYNVSYLMRSSGALKLYDPPACTKESANYFAANKKLFSDKESAEAALYAEFDAQIAAGKNVVEIRVNSKSLYDEMMTDDAFRTYQKYAKGKSDSVKQLQRQSSNTKGVYVVHYDVVYN